MSTLMFNTMCESFQMRYVMTFYSKSIKNTKSLSFKIPKSLLLLSKVESLNLKVVAVLMPLEIKRHTVPHLKALTRSIDHWGRHGHSSTFKLHYTVLKSTILLHKSAKWRFHVTVAVWSWQNSSASALKIFWGCRKLPILMHIAKQRSSQISFYSCHVASPHVTISAWVHLSTKNERGTGNLRI